MFKKPIALWAVVAIVATVAVSGSLFLGYRLGQLDPRVVTVKGITNVDDPDVKADFGLFWQVWEKLKEYHISGDTTPDKDLVYGSVAGLVNSLGDPYTVFFPPAEAKKFEEDVRGSFGGIGAEIGVREDQLTIIAPLKDSPAEKAGILAKDKILAVDGTPTDSVSLTDAISKIRGENGTKVTLTILRNGWTTPKDFVIVRDEIRVPTIDWDVKDGLLHLKFYAFNQNAPTLFYKAIADAAERDARGIVLDMRNNPGGYLDIAVYLAGWFLEKGSLVVTEDFKVGQDTVFTADGNEALKNFPVVVLVNGGSASASEILAGALRDNRGIKLVGEKTFGKGTVQEVQDLKDNSTLKITIASWLTPSGKTIDKNGLAPDYEVKITEEDAKEGRDPQLEKAFEVLRSLIVN